MRIIIFSTLVVLSTLLLADVTTHAHAQRQVAAAPRSVDCVGHRGFHFHFDVDFGASYISNARNDKSGVGATPINLNVSLGGAVAPNLILAGDMGVFSSGPVASEDDSVPVAFGYHLSVSLKHYFMPANIFVMGSAGGLIAITSASDDNIGPFFRFGVGKEWLVTNYIGLGLGAYFAYGALFGRVVHYDGAGTRLADETTRTDLLQASIAFSFSLR